jgi:hypothetical protein
VIRVVLAVLLAIALLAVSTTALEYARTARSDRLADGEVGELTDAVAELRGGEEGVPGADHAARRVVDVAVPAGGVGTAPVSYVAIGGVPGRSLANDTDERDVVASRLEGGPVRRRWVPVAVRTPGPESTAGDETFVEFAPDDEPLVLRQPSTVELSLVRRGGRPVVLASRR